MATNLLLADGNLIADATVVETGWETNTPAANAQSLPLGIAAVSTGAGTEVSPVVYKGVLSNKQPITYAGLFATNMNQKDSYRLELFSNEDYTGSVFDTRVDGIDKKVIPCLSSWRELRFGAPNLLRGDFPPEQFDLYPTNIHVQVPLCRARSFKWSLVGRGYLKTDDPATNGDPADYISIGLAWLSDSIELNYKTPVGGERIWRPGDDITNVPGGGVFVEPGTGKRLLRIPLEVIHAVDTNRLTDQAARVGFDQPVVVIPDVEDLGDTFRYGFLAQRRGDFSKTQRFFETDQATLEYEEITT
jgi:hypothetical protein